MRPRHPPGWRAAACWLLLATAPAAFAEGEAGAAGEDESLLFALRLDQQVLSEDLAVYAAGGRFYLPFGELCRLLDLAIAVDPARGLATGFVIDEKRRLALDLGAGRLSLGGAAPGAEQREIAAAAVLRRPEDIYVESGELAAWLPADFEIAFTELEVRVKPREKLPLQLRLEREKKLAAGGARAPVELPRRAVPYQLFDGPLLDASLRYSRRPEDLGERRDDLEYSLATSGDLLFAEAELFLYGNQEEILDSRFSLGRKDPDGRLLGRLGAREVSIGEVFHPGLELIALPRSGPGVLLSNFPLGLSSQLGRENFRGDLPPGWEAELYRGEELLAYTRSRPDGLYEFLDVPLLLGLNLFRVELYGPQGQRRTESRLLNVDDSLTPPGELRYRLAANDPGERLFGRGPLEVGPRVSLELGAGLAERLAATFSLASVDYRERRSSFAQAGLRTARGPLLASFDVALEEGGGRAWQADLQSRWRAFGIQVKHAELDGLESEAFVAAGGPLARRSWLRLDTVLPPFSFLPRVPLYFDLRQDQLENGQRLTELGARFSIFSRGLALTHLFIYSSTAGEPEGREPAPKTAAGQLLVSKFLPTWAFRGEADYQLEPLSELTTLTATAELRRGSGLTFSGGVTRVFTSRDTRYQLGASKLEGALGYTVLADYGDRRGFGASLLLSVSLSRDSRSGRWRHQARPLAYGGALSARVFLDQDGNGAFDLGEPPIAGAGLLLGGGNHLARSGEDGEIFLANLPPWQPLSVGLAASTLEDPYWQPASPGARIVPRPGKVALLDFPVEISGEISGTLYLQRGERRREAPGIEIELVNAAGEVVAKSRSASDGFYVLDRLKPGKFKLRIAAAQLGRLRLLAPPEREVELEPSGSVLDNLDFTLAPLAAEGN